MSNQPASDGNGLQTHELASSSPIASARGLSRLLGRPLLATVVTTLFTLVARVLIFRVLDAEAAGRYAVLVAVAQVLTPFGNLGQWSLTLRQYSKPGREAYDWPLDFRNELLIAIGPIAIGAWIAGTVYSVSAAETAFTLTSALLNLAILISAYRLASRRHYSWSNSLIRLPGAIMIVASLTASALPRLATLGFFLGTQLAAFLCVTLLSITLVAARLPRGSRTITLRQRLGALAFLPSPFVQIASEGGLTAVAGLALAPGQVAAFSAIATLFRPFRLTRQIASQVFTSEQSRKRRIDHRRFGPLWVLLSLLAGVLGLVVVPPASLVLYGDRFLDGLLLTPWLAAAGSFNLIESLPHSYLVGNGSVADNTATALAQVGIVVFGLGLGLLLGVKVGLPGIGAASMTIHLSRATISTYIAMRADRRPHRSLP